MSDKKTGKPAVCETPETCPLNRPMTMFVKGLVAGLALAAVAILFVFPKLMLTTRAGTQGFDETVTALQKSIKDNGWSSPATLDLNKSMAKHGVEMAPRVTVVELCNAEYAKEVLTDARDVSAIMPCRIAVWEDDAGKVHLSTMNTGIIGKLFGGTVARVMGGPVSKDQRKILAPVVVE